MDCDKIVSTLKTRGYSARDILLGILPYIREGCLDEYTDRGEFVEVDVCHRSTTTTQTTKHVAPSTLRTVTVKDGNDGRCKRFSVVGADSVADFTSASRDIVEYLVDDMNRICGEVRLWYDHNNSVDDSVKDDAGYVCKDGCVVYEYEIYASKAIDGSIRSGIYRVYKYSRKQGRLLETGEIL